MVSFSFQVQESLGNDQSHADHGPCSYREPKPGMLHRTRQNHRQNSLNEDLYLAAFQVETKINW